MGDEQRLTPAEQIAFAREGFESATDFTVAAEEELALLALPKEERRELGAAARRAAVSRWSWASVADRLLQPFN